MSDEDRTPLPNSLMSRMIGAGRLDERFYRDISEDSGAILQALVVVMLAAMASRFSIGGVGFLQIIFAILRLTAWWVVLTLAIYVLAVTLFRSQSKATGWLRLARTMGFAQSPLVLRGILILPFISGPVWVLLFYAATGWQFAAIIAAVRTTLKVESTASAVLMVGLAFVPMVIVIEPFILG